MTRVRDFFTRSDWIDHEVLRPLSHIRANWELRWDFETGLYVHEQNSYAALLNALIDELDTCTPPKEYHDNEDRLGEHVQKTLNWGVYKRGTRWVDKNGAALGPSDYIVLLEQGGFGDADEHNLVLAAAGRIKAAITRGQKHFDEMERSHQQMLAGVLAVILYHRGSNE